MLPFLSEDGGTVVPSPDGNRAMISSKDGAFDLEIDLATGRPLWTMSHVLDVAPLLKQSKPIAGRFTAFGSYYLTDDYLRALRLGKTGQNVSAVR